MITATPSRGDAGSSSIKGPSTSSSAIRPIPSTDVHRITSGQVVLDLQTAVKELLENALDASATNIAINFRDYGADSFEVVDNGTGIDPSNYASVGLKHYTSKLSSFSDLAIVRTFGFRGEALSSLCALAKVTIHTATSSQAPMGTLLRLDRAGRVESDTGRAARQRGTTVTVEGLFTPLPVRRKEFEKNLKREYTKAQNLLQAYALITQGVRWTITNTPAGGRKVSQFSVNSSTAQNYLSANVSSLFGAKIAPTLMPLNLRLTFSVAAVRNTYLQGVAGAVARENDEEIASPSDPSPAVTVVGLISKPVYGSGRTSPDRQFFYINGRPWDAGRVCRAFNEVYKSFNSNHFPFIIADFRLPTDSYDVNVSPDKRTIFLHEESRLIEKVKEALEALFAPSRATFLVNGASHSLRNGNGITSLSAQSQLSSPTSKTKALGAEEADRHSSDEEAPIVADGAEDPERAESGLAEETWSDDTDGEDHIERQVNSARSRSRSRPRRTESQAGDLEYREDSSSPQLLADLGNAQAVDESEPDVPAPLASETVPQPLGSVKRDYGEVRDASQASWLSAKKPRTPQPSAVAKRAPESTLSERTPSEAKTVLASLRTFALPGTQVSDPLPVSSRMALSEIEDEEESTPMAIEPEEAAGSSDDDQELDAPAHGGGVDQESDEPSFDGPATMQEVGYAHDGGKDAESISFDFDGLQERLRGRKMAAERSAYQTSAKGLSASGDEDVLQGAGVGNQDEEQVERALSRIIHKRDFSCMDVVGQFNLGFIIARRRIQPDSTWDGMDDLFIVDQHASDEKFNFETLQLTTQIRSQRLISPRSLELSASDELVAIEHQDTLLSNGFEVRVSESGLPGTRVKLVAQPISKSTVFGVKDLEELLYLLRDTSAGSEAARAIRCSKARSMFASRACRKSVMIGTALNKVKMEAILRNMGMIEQPWNCPHGRPTMRHLACLKTISEQGQDAKEQGPTWFEVVRCLG